MQVSRIQRREGEERMPSWAIFGWKKNKNNENQK